MEASSSASLNAFCLLDPIRAHPYHNESVGQFVRPSVRLVNQHKHRSKRRQDLSPSSGPEGEAAGLPARGDDIEQARVSGLSRRALPHLVDHTFRHKGKGWKRGGGGAMLELRVVGSNGLASPAAPGNAPRS